MWALWLKPTLQWKCTVICSKDKFIPQHSTIYWCIKCLNEMDIYLYCLTPVIFKIWFFRSVLSLSFQGFPFYLLTLLYHSIQFPLKIKVLKECFSSNTIEEHCWVLQRTVLEKKNSLIICRTFFHYKEPFLQWKDSMKGSSWNNNEPLFLRVCNPFTLHSQCFG